jgi:hypothetical protein
MVLIALPKLYTKLTATYFMTTVDLPLFDRSFIANYLKAIHVLIDLLGKLLK